MEEQQKNRITTYVGMALIFVLMFLWMKYATPTEPTAVESSKVEQAPSSTTNTTTQNAETGQVTTTPVTDSLRTRELSGKLGGFASAGLGTDRTEVLENELVRIEFSTKGGRIKLVEVKNYTKLNLDSADNEVKSQLYLLEDAKNRFDYTLNVQGAEGGKVVTSDLFFEVSREEIGRAHV